MQQLNIHTWHPMPAYTRAHTKAFANTFAMPFIVASKLVSNLISDMMRCIEMEIKQVKITI